MSCILCQLVGRISKSQCFVEVQDLQGRLARYLFRVVDVQRFQRVKPFLRGNNFQMGLVVLLYRWEEICPGRKTWVDNVLYLRNGVLRCMMNQLEHDGSKGIHRDPVDIRYGSWY